MTDESAARDPITSFDIEAFKARVRTLHEQVNTPEGMRLARGAIRREVEATMDSLGGEMAGGQMLEHLLAAILEVVPDIDMPRMRQMNGSFRAMYLDESQGRTARFKEKHGTRVLLVDTPDRFALAMLQVVSERLRDDYYERDISQVPRKAFEATTVPALHRVILDQAALILDTVPTIKETGLKRYTQSRAEMVAMKLPNSVASAPLLNRSVVQAADLVAMVSTVVRVVGSAREDRLANFLVEVMEADMGYFVRADFEGLRDIVATSWQAWPETTATLNRVLHEVADDYGWAMRIIEMAKTDQRRAGRAAYELLKSRERHQYEEMELESPELPEFEAGAP